MSVTVRQNYRKSNIYEKLVDKHGIFDSYVDLFVFSGCLGYSRNTYHQDGYEGTGDTKGEMLWMHFSDKDMYRAAAASIAFQHTDDPKSLLDAGVQLDVLAMYASAGAEILEEKFGSTMGSPRDAVLNMVQNERTVEERREDTGTLRELEKAFEINL